MVYTSPPSPSAPTKRLSTKAEARRASSAAPAHVQQRWYDRDMRLAALGFASYGEYLRSPGWIETRGRFRVSQLPQECICGAEDVHLHHLTYERLGRERLSDLLPLCRKCHQMVHELERRGLIGLDLEGLVLDEERAAAGRALLHRLLVERQREQEARIAQEQAEVLAMPFATRLLRARDAAHARRRDVSHHTFRIKTFVSRGRAHQATLWLRRMEEHAYGWEGWGDSVPGAL